MKDNYTHISIMIDRSGSMNTVRSDAEGAVNHFLNEQKALPDKCSLLLADFDAEEPFRVVFDGAIADAPRYRLSPRGSTPLLDAVARIIHQTGDNLSGMVEADRPGKVIVVIQTDGMENASKEHTWEQVAALIKRQTEVYSWQFIFLGMGLDTFKQGDRLGIANVVRTGANNAATHFSTLSVLSRNTSAYRQGHSPDMSAMRGVRVDAAGKVFNEAGEEIDPLTGNPLTK